MVLSVKERQRRWRHKQTGKGNRAVTVNMTPETYATLQAIKKETGRNFSEIVNRAVTSNIISANKWYAGSRVSEPSTEPDVGERFRGKRKDGLKTQSQITVAALQLFAERGYNATTVEDIIVAVRIARRTFYLHFKGKKDLLSHIIDEYLGIFSDIIDANRELTFQKSSEEIKSIATNTAEQILTNTELRWFIKLMLGEIIGLQDTFSARIDRYTDSIINRVSETIRRVQDDGIISKRLSPLIAAFCLGGGFKEILFQHVVRGRDLDLAESISGAVDLFANGFFD